MIKKIGKKGEINIKARKMIRDIAEEKSLSTCEVKLPGCMRNFGIAPAHRHRRVNYRTAEELADYREWVVACQSCHEKMDSDQELLERVFNRLR